METCQTCHKVKTHLAEYKGHEICDDCYKEEKESDTPIEWETEHCYHSVDTKTFKEKHGRFGEIERDSMRLECCICGYVTDWV